MPVPPAIVVYGHDQSLLDTRTWVLERAGYTVSTASRFSELEQVTQNPSVSLVVMCHTLTQQECEETWTTLDQHRPEIKRLMITANRPLSPHVVGSPAISAFDGPRALIDIVDRLLSPKD